MPRFQLIDARFDSVGDGRLRKKALRQCPRIEFVPIDAARPFPGVRAGIGQIHRTIGTQFGDQLELALLGHLERVMIPKVAIQHQIGQRKQRARAHPQGADHGLDAPQLGVQGHGRFGFGETPFRSPRLPLWRWGRSGADLGLRDGFFFGGADDLLNVNGKRPALFGTDQRQAEKRDTGHRFTIQTGKEAIQSRRVLAGFGDHGFITAEQIAIVGVEKVCPKEQPEQRGPRQGGSEEPLDGTVAAPIATPAGDTEHRDTPGQGKHGQRDSAELAERRHRDLRLKAQQEW